MYIVLEPNFQPVFMHHMGINPLDAPINDELYSDFASTLSGSSNIYPVQ